jgi:integrase
MSITTLPSGRFRLQIRRRHLHVDEIHDRRDQALKALERYLNKAIAPKSKGPTLQQVWELYQESLAFLNKKETTRRSEATHIKPALERLGARALGAIQPDDVEALIKARLKAKKAPDTIRNEVAVLSVVFTYAIGKQLVVRNPCIGIKRPPLERVLRRMAPTDEGALMQLLTHPKLRYRSVARLCLLVRETGARPGEWAATRWTDIDLGARKVTFSNTKYKGMPRTIPLTQSTMGLLGAQLEDIAVHHLDQFGDSEFVFPTLGRDGSVVQLAYSGTVRDMKRTKLLPQRFRPHSGRHEFVSKLVEDSDLDDSRIMALVGHHSPASMQIYAHARNVRLRPQLEALESGRRVERARSLSSAIGLPPEVVASYLKHRRAKDGVDDAGDELLFTESALNAVNRAANKLGKTEAERLATLLKFRVDMARKVSGGEPTAKRAPKSVKTKARR